MFVDVSGLFILVLLVFRVFFFFFKQKTAYEMRISDWSSDVCSSDLFEADVVLSARRVLLEELHDRRVLAQRLDQLDLAVGRIDEAHTHALRRQVERLVDLRRAKQADVHFDRFLDRRRRNADMVEATDRHYCLSTISAMP